MDDSREFLKSNLKRHADRKNWLEKLYHHVEEDKEEDDREADREEDDKNQRQSSEIDTLIKSRRSKGIENSELVVQELSVVDTRQTMMQKMQQHSDEVN